MKIGEELQYYNGFCGNQDNTKFWEKFYRIKDTGEFIKARWSGDYYVRAFVCNDGTYEIWENTEYGIFHSIKRIA